MSGLRQWAAAAKHTQPSAADKQGWSWVVEGGLPSVPHTSSHAGSHSGDSYANVYCTGHSDGSVRLWDMHGQVQLPVLMVDRLPRLASVLAVTAHLLLHLQPFSCSLALFGCGSSDS